MMHIGIQRSRFGSGLFGRRSVATAASAILNTTSTRSATSRSTQGWRPIAIGTVNGHLRQGSQIGRLFGLARKGFWYGKFTTLASSGSTSVGIAIGLIGVFISVPVGTTISLTLALSFTQALRRFIDGSLVRDGIPKTRAQIAFQKASLLLFDGLHNGLGHEQLGMFGTSAVQRSIAANQATVPFIAGVVIGHAPASAQDVLHI
jgi:hypothetical protein